LPDRPTRVAARRLLECIEPVTNSARRAMTNSSALSRPHACTPDAGGSA
jgi:hypothetical protein